MRRERCWFGRRRKSLCRAYWFTYFASIIAHMQHLCSRQLALVCSFARHLLIQRRVRRRYRITRRKCLFQRFVEGSVNPLLPFFVDLKLRSSVHELLLNLIG